MEKYKSGVIDKNPMRQIFQFIRKLIVVGCQSPQSTHTVFAQQNATSVITKVQEIPLPSGYIRIAAHTYAHYLRQLGIATDPTVYLMVN